MEGEKFNSYSPGSSFKFQVKGDPGAKVSLVAVDNAIFLLSKNRLTQKKVSVDVIFTVLSRTFSRVSLILMTLSFRCGRWWDRVIWAAPQEEARIIWVFSVMQD